MVFVSVTVVISLDFLAPENSEASEEFSMNCTRVVGVRRGVSVDEFGVDGAVELKLSAVNNSPVPNLAGSNTGSVVELCNARVEEGAGTKIENEGIDEDVLVAFT